MSVFYNGGFGVGKEFRTFFEFSLVNNEQIVIKAVVPINVVLRSVETVITQGNIRVETVVGGTEGGDFLTTLPVFNRNNMTDKPKPLYTSQVTLTAGGTHTGGTLLDLMVNKAANGSSAIATVGTMFDDDRGVAPNTYYYRIFASEISTGIFKVRWEERP